MLASRVDWLTVAFRAKLRDATIAELLAKLDTAERAGSGRVAVALAGRIFELRETRGRGRYLLTNADVVATLELGAAEGWTIAVEYSGARISQLTMKAAIALARSVARELGTVFEERVRRLDLCADVERFDLDALEECAWVKPRRARLQACTADALEKVYEPGRRTYERGGRITGVSICPGNPIQLVAYDKREELDALPDPRKRDFEEGIWRGAGWDGETDVARVEFRFRSEALRELGARDKLDALEEKLDGLWQYACAKWVRLVVRGSASRLCNCAIDDRWRVVQEHVFRHRAGHATRVRLRGGASSAHAFGTTLSRLASGGACPRPPDFVDEHGQPTGDDEEMYRIAPIEARTLLELELERVLMASVPLLAEDFAQRFRSPHRAAAFVRLRARAATARFHTERTNTCKVSTG